MKYYSILEYQIRKCFTINHFIRSWNRPIKLIIKEFKKFDIESLNSLSKLNNSNWNEFIKIIIKRSPMIKKSWMHTIRYNFNYIDSYPMNEEVKELLIDRMRRKKNKKLISNPHNKYVYKLAHLRPLINSTKTLDERIKSISNKSHDQININ